MSSRGDVIKKKKKHAQKGRKNISYFKHNKRDAGSVSVDFSSPPCGAVVILSVLISLWARRGIDLTYCSISSGGTDRHPMVKQPDEVVNLVTLDLALLTRRSNSGTRTPDSINTRAGVGETRAL